MLRWRQRSRAVAHLTLDSRPEIGFRKRTLSHFPNGIGRDNIVHTADRIRLRIVLANPRNVPIVVERCARQLPSKLNEINTLLTPRSLPQSRVILQLWIRFHRRSGASACPSCADTSPEMSVRRIAHALGYRYRLHRSDLPGCPDLVFPSRRKVVFVHGCYWHWHAAPSCKLSRLPKSRLEFWLPKLRANQLRDSRNVRALRSAGWGVLILWECQLGNRAKVEKRLTQYLGDGYERD